MEAIKVFRKGNDVIKIEPIDHYEEEIMHGNIEEFVVFRKKLIRRHKIKKNALIRADIDQLKELSQSLGITSKARKKENIIKAILIACGTDEEEKESEKK